MAPAPLKVFKSSLIITLKCCDRTAEDPKRYCFTIFTLKHTETCEVIFLTNRRSGRHGEGHEERQDHSERPSAGVRSHHITGRTGLPEGDGSRRKLRLGQPLVHDLPHQTGKHTWSRRDDLRPEASQESDPTDQRRGILVTFRKEGWKF